MRERTIAACLITCGLVSCHSFKQPFPNGVSGHGDRLSIPQADSDPGEDGEAQEEVARWTTPKRSSAVSYERFDQQGSYIRGRWLKDQLALPVDRLVDLCPVERDSVFALGLDQADWLHDVRTTLFLIRWDESDEMLTLERSFPLGIEAVDDLVVDPGGARLWLRTIDFDRVYSVEWDPEQRTLVGPVEFAADVGDFVNAHQMVPDSERGGIKFRLHLGWGELSFWDGTWIDRIVQTKNGFRVETFEHLGLLDQWNRNLRMKDQVWNRALEATWRDIEGLRHGDLALRDIFRFDGPMKNGGTLHAIEFLGTERLEDAIAGFRAFGLEATADRIQTIARDPRPARLNAIESEIERLEDLDEIVPEALETELSSLSEAMGELEELIDYDDELEHALSTQLRSEPDAFAPIAESDDGAK
ncbi:MAG: hypothetical protein AAF196_16355 [Planctomycetota bacterium]